jgi:hypothetical protein
LVDVFVCLYKRKELKWIFHPVKFMCVGRYNRQENITFGKKINTDDPEAMHQ